MGKGKRKTKSKSRSTPKKRKKRRTPKKEEKWIAGAIEKPGTLRATVKRRYGSKGFTQRGTIRRKVLTELSTEPGVTGKRARLAKTLRKL